MTKKIYFANVKKANGKVTEVEIVFEKDIEVKTSTRSAERGAYRRAKNWYYESKQTFDWERLFNEEELMLFKEYYGI